MNRADMRHDLIDWVADFKPTLEVTLGAGLSCAPATLNRDARRFFNTMERCANGPRWAKKGGADRILAFGFHEHMSSNHHMHLLVRAPARTQEQIALVGSLTWKSIRMAGDFHWSVIRDRERYARYATKELWRSEAYENFFIYTAPEFRNR